MDGDLVIGQTAAILLYLGPRLQLAGAGDTDALWTHQLQLTIADAVAEAHDAHHPLSTGLYYEDQREAAAARAKAFRAECIPKFLSWFEDVLQRNPEGDAHLVGDALTYADLSLFQLVAGLRYAFPVAVARALADTPAVVKLHDGVARRQRVHARRHLSALSGAGRVTACRRCAIPVGVPAIARPRSACGRWPRS